MKRMLKRWNLRADGIPRQRVRLARVRSLEFVTKLWRRTLRRRWETLQHWLPGLIPVVIVIGLFLWVWKFESDRMLGDQLPSFLNSLATEAIGLLAAFAFAWFLIERHREAEHKRISHGIRDELLAVRHAAAMAITVFTQRVYEAPNFYQDQPSEWYFRAHYQELKALLNNSSQPPVLKYAEDQPGKEIDNPDRGPSHWDYVWRSLGGVNDSIIATREMYGSVLVQYPELLKAFRAFRNGYERELRQWERFKEASRRSEDEGQRITRELLMSGAKEGYPPRAGICVSARAIQNLWLLTLHAWALVALITKMYKDWDFLPTESECEIPSYAWWAWVRRP